MEHITACKRILEQTVQLRTGYYMTEKKKELRDLFIKLGKEKLDFSLVNGVVRNRDVLEELSNIMSNGNLALWEQQADNKEVSLGQLKTQIRIVDGFFYSYCIMLKNIILTNVSIATRLYFRPDQYPFLCNRYMVFCNQSVQDYTLGDVFFAIKLISKEMLDMEGTDNSLKEYLEVLMLRISQLCCTSLPKSICDVEILYVVTDGNKDEEMTFGRCSLHFRQTCLEFYIWTVRPFMKFLRLLDHTQSSICYDPIWMNHYSEDAIVDFFENWYLHATNVIEKDMNYFMEMHFWSTCLRSGEKEMYKRIVNNRVYANSVIVSHFRGETSRNRLIESNHLSVREKLTQNHHFQVGFAVGCILLDFYFELMTQCTWQALFLKTVLCSLEDNPYICTYTGRPALYLKKKYYYYETPIQLFSAWINSIFVYYNGEYTIDQKKKKFQLEKKATTV